MKITFDHVHARATANGTFKVTHNQLFAAYMAMTAASSGGHRVLRLLTALGFLLVGAPVAMIAGKTSACLFAIFAGGVLLSWNMWPRPDHRDFVKLLQARLATRQPVPGYINPGALNDRPPVAGESDIHHYGAQRLLIVEDDATVDLLVSNGFHAQNQVVVTSMSGYPHYLSTLIDGLLQNPNLQVFLLHRPGKPGAWHVTRMMHDPRIGHRGPNMMSCGIEKDDGLLSLPELKFWARGCKEQFATDMVPYATLAGLLAESMNTRKTMSRILAARRAAQRAARGTGQRSVAAGYYDGGGHDFG